MRMDKEIVRSVLDLQMETAVQICWICIQSVNSWQVTNATHRHISIKLLYLITLSETKIVSYPQKVKLKTAYSLQKNAMLLADLLSDSFT